MKIKKLLLVLVSLAMLSPLGMRIGANEFESNRAYYETLCFTKVDPTNAAVCRDFQKHIGDQSKQVLSDLNSIRKDLSAVRADITRYGRQINEYQSQIDELERQIEVLERSIESLAAEIEILAADVEILEESINERDITIKERMLAMQGFLSINGFIDIIMGASNFTDLVRRIEGIQDITHYDNEQIKLMQSERDLLELDKIELERQRNVLEENRENLVTSQASLGALIEIREEIISEFRRQESQLIKQEREVAADYSQVQSQLKKVESALSTIPDSSGWLRPILTGARISAGAWYYPRGGLHLAVDFAAPVGTAVVAVANGVVVYRANNCPTYGYLGNSCGYPGATGGGNQIYLIVSVNNKSYGIIYAHLENGSPTNVGRVVKGGDVIGRVGSSGNSSGPHTHVEVVYLGTNSVNYYAQNWGGNLSFGAGWSTTGYRRRCEANGHTPPCRLNPLNVFNVRVGQRY